VNSIFKAERKKSIGLVAPFFPPEIGGANIYCYELARALSAKGLDVHVFARLGDLEDSAYTLHPILTLKLEEDLKRLLTFQMDIWHSLYFYYLPLALYHENVFVTGHGDDFFSPRIRFTLTARAWLEKNILWRLSSSVSSNINHKLIKAEMIYNRYLYGKAIHSTRQFITVSNFSKNRFCLAFPNAKDKTVVVPPGVSDAFFSTTVSSPKSNLFLTVTRLDEHDRIKNVHGVILALADLKDHYKFQYVIIAGAVTGQYRDELERLVIDKGLQDYVSIEGRKSLDELLSHYCSADLFILVSYAEANNFEGFGIVFLEANAAGVPVLTSREGGMSDYVKDGVNGFYVDTPSSEGIKDSLQKYMDGRIRFDREQVRQAPDSFRWSAIADRVLDVYEQHSI
jgi:phosphatidyl-myo-inositol dimannoside synthase